MVDFALTEEDREALELARAMTPAQRKAFLSAGWAYVRASQSPLERPGPHRSSARGGMGHSSSSSD